MKSIAFNRAKLVIGAGVATCLSVAIWTNTHGSSTPSFVAKTTILAIDGSQLTSIFEGLSPDPRIDLKLLRDPIVKPCAPKAWTLFEKFKGWFQPIAFAQNSCASTVCSGQQFVNALINCVQTGCSGQFNNAHWDASGDAAKGGRENGQAACPGSGCAQICNTVTCDAPTTCETCTDQNDYRCGGPGYPCIGGCCGPLQCNHGGFQDFFCNNPSDCSGLPYCVNGCCAECYSDAQCAYPDTCNVWGHCASVSPVIVDVLGDGFSLTDANHGVDFDFRGDGKKVRIAWTSRGSDDAWLVLDRNGNGLIDSGKEMFGNITNQPKSDEPNGFLALGEFDKRANGGNGDGIIDSRDAIFSRLQLWQDKNHDGISQSSELFKLIDLGVESIDLAYQETQWVDGYGNQFRFRSKVDDAKHSHVGRWAYDVFLVVQK